MPLISNFSKGINKFSATVICLNRSISCGTYATFLNKSLFFIAFLPSTKTSPSSGVYTPVRHFINVLFPAPFSPITACISPGSNEISTESRAKTPGNFLLIFFASNTDTLTSFYNFWY